jgi:hypothetical protein
MSQGKGLDHEQEVKKRTIKTTHRLPQSEIGGLPRLSLLTQDLGGLV